MAERVEVQGLDGLLKSLRGLPKAVQGKPLQSGIRAGGNLIRDEARRRAPKATGAMAKAIVTRRANARNRRKAGVGEGGEYYTVGVMLGRKTKYADTKRNRRMRRVGKSYRVDSDVYYWRFKEFGTKKMAAEPFLTPAAEAKGPEAAQVVIDATRKAIDKYTRETGWR